ncbi:dephospho-CoA kinase [Lactococcus lactis]|uniref:dephospho-CoA kinase n=1 Tax=Lactococcus lactis TaxID=1358 RepID=UPI002078BB4A|nr:dephospho-CoA kinase [Lactococcus lactis]MCT0444561.1 dephospho-CoA kinase [Lactococcus lactis subsp. lactis]MDM7535462.1 dephospho-CoA kinase [Lactococcus lactis]USI63629.1 dephospho-CoA kinase [Lactococcus lactis subsp. lactis]
MKMVIGLTGGIASGKSTVVDFLISEGYQVIDADKVVRQLQEPGGKLYKAIVETYGLDFIADNGQLNREKLGALVFSDSKEREKLSNLQDEIIRTELYDRRDDLLKKMTDKSVSKTFDSKSQGKNLSVNKPIFMDIPLLIEYNYTGFDEIWLVSLPEKIQLERLMARNKFTEEEAKKRISSQMPLSEKQKVADVILDNSGTIEALKKQIQRELARIEEQK